MSVELINQATVAERYGHKRSSGATPLARTALRSDARPGPTLYTELRLAAKVIRSSLFFLVALIKRTYQEQANIFHVVFEDQINKANKNVLALFEGKFRYFKQILNSTQLRKILPEELGECWLERLLDRCCGAWGGDPPAERGEPGGRVSATDISAAIGDGPAPVATDTGGEPAVRPKGDPAEPFVSGALL